MLLEGFIAADSDHCQSTVHYIAVADSVFAVFDNNPAADAKLAVAETRSAGTAEAAARTVEYSHAAIRQGVSNGAAAAAERIATDHTSGFGIAAAVAYRSHTVRERNLAFAASIGQVFVHTLSWESAAIAPGHAVVESKHYRTAVSVDRPGYAAVVVL